MRKSERLRQLELTVVRMEMHLELLGLALDNLMAAQGFQEPEPKPEPQVNHNAMHRLQAGKWYPRTQDNS